MIRESELCPAKVNLFLSVGPKDGRGYHPLRTVFQAVGLFDQVQVEEAELDSVSFSVPGIGDQNTVSRALRLMREIADFPPLKVTVEKQIPIQSGLGGGSSDAAGLIRIIRKICHVPLPEAELHQVALAIGADVPFFLVGGKARATGYGEILTPLPDDACRWLCLIWPGVGCSTPEMFKRLDEISFPWVDFPHGVGGSHNDFERVAPCECLELIEQLESLGARQARLSGSGSSVFGVFDSAEEAEAARSQLPKYHATSWVVPTLSRAESLCRS